MDLETTRSSSIAAGRILVDLKPAFDGYAGIPQETRLLFRALKMLDGWRTQGLIQHGGKRLGAGLRLAADGNVALGEVAEQIDQLSRLIISTHGRSGNRWLNVAHAWGENLSSMSVLRAKTLVGIPVKPTAFCAKHFPDFVWRTLFDKSLDAADKNLLTADDYLVLDHSRKNLQQLCQKTFLSGDISKMARVDTRGFDFFLAQTPFPGRVDRHTQLIVRYHDAVPVFLPHTIKDKAFHQETHFRALRGNVASGAKFVCVSEASRRDLLTIFPQAETAAHVIHNIVSAEYYEDDSAPSVVPHVARNRLAEVKQFTMRAPEAATVSPFPYVLMVSTLEPRKNHMVMLSAWEQLKYSTHPELKLVVVGNVGWDATGILRAFRPWVESGDLLYLQNVPTSELRALYKHASLTICPSVSEGFDYSGVEAMRCGCPVVASSIPVHHEVYQDAAIYFDPYSADLAAHAMKRVLMAAGQEVRHQLVDRGRAVARHYLPDVILPLWREFLSTGAKTRPPQYDSVS